MAAAVAALVWANLAWSSYEDFWSTGVVVELGALELEADLRGVVNDLLMAIFFFVVALELKREVIFGSLRDWRAAAVPIAAAAGTMAGGAVVYVAVNLGGGDLRGWAIPMATDIAFALGVLGLAGNRVPGGLRVFLLTLTVVDDVGSIIVIAVFFSKGISVAWLGVAAGAALTMLLLQRLAVRLVVPYVALAVVLWLAIVESGVHATIAGVILGLLTPAIAFHPQRETAETITAQLGELSSSDDEVSELTMWETSRLAREAVSPLVRIEDQLHPWSAYLILPLFALANAGVELSLDGIGTALAGPVGGGIALGLVVGAPLGGLLLIWMLVHIGRARLPKGLDWSALGAVAPLKGIGFTVAIFLSVLAFDDEVLREQAKIAVLIASLLAAITGFGTLSLHHMLTRRR
jgi:Na+:H+ antiporter, NhaA family